MEYSNVSKNEMTHINIDVKLEPFDEDYDYTRNVDPLGPDNNVHTKIEVLQDFKMEIQAVGSNQATEKDLLKFDQDNTEIKIENQDIKTECFGNEALDTILDTCRVIQDSTSVPNQLSENSSKYGSVEIQTQTDKTNNTTYEISHSCELQPSDVFNEMSTNDGSSLNGNSAANHSRTRSDTCSSGVAVLKIHKHSTSEEEVSKQSSSLIALRHPSYVFDVCDMKFKKSRNLVSHKVVHTDQKPHICDVCKKGFRKSYDLGRHKRIHTGEKPFACDICKKEFNQSSALVTHKRMHTGEKPYDCNICKNRFSNSSALARHTRTHTGQKPYICDFCKKAFSGPSDLVAHKRTHTGEKPYVCDICKKGFTNSSHLIKHKRTHFVQKSCVKPV